MSNTLSLFCSAVSDDEENFLWRCRQVLSSLETIFNVRIPGSSSAPELVSNYLEIFDSSEALSELRLENGSLDYPELISDILSQVLVNISQGKPRDSRCVQGPVASIINTLWL